MKQSSPSCERNKEPILAVLREILSVPGLVLEIGSGSGQHAVHFARGLSHVEWQPTDVAENLSGISAWRDEAGLANLREPLALDLFSDRWPITAAQAVVCIIDPARLFLNEDQLDIYYWASVTNRACRDNNENHIGFPIIAAAWRLRSRAGRMTTRHTCSSRFMPPQ